MKYLAFSAALAIAMAGTASAETLKPAFRLDEVRFVEAAPLPPSLKPGEFVIVEEQPLPAMTKAQLLFGFERGKALEAAASRMDPATREAMLKILQPSN